MGRLWANRFGITFPAYFLALHTQDLQGSKFTMLKSRRNRVNKPFFMALGLLLSASLVHSQGTWVDLSNGTDMTGLYKQGSATVTFNGGIISVTGSDSYLGTNKEYTHYRVKYEWNNSGSGSKNSGFLFHIGQDRIWPLGLECQTMSSDVGSLWTTGCKFTSTGTKSSSGTGGTFSETGPVINDVGTTGTSRSNFVRTSTGGNPYLGDNVWNTFEMLVKNDSIEIKVNDKLTMRAWKITVSNGTPLVKGKVGLQIEGAAVQFRKWQIMDLAGTTSIAPMRDGRNISFVDRSGYRLFIDPVVRGNALIAPVMAGKPAGTGLLDINGRLQGGLPD
jgi:hypothetical protein